MSPAELETLMLFLAHNQPMFAATCRDMKTDPARIARAVARQHARAIEDAEPTPTLLQYLTKTR